ncbi:peptide synthase [Mycolicibacterium porcinum]|nr:peptide synthase [Mycolicibacterium porcinum]
MSPSESSHPHRVPLSRSQQNIYRGAIHDDDHGLYLIGRRYRFRPIPQAVFLSALRATILANPVQLCVLVAPSDAGGYPDLVPGLAVDDIVRVCGDDESAELAHDWRAGILRKPLVRYIVRVDGRGLVHGLDAQAHHLLLDGGAIGVVEAHLGRFLAGGGLPDDACVRDGLTRLATAHRREAARIDESQQRLTAAVQRELAAAGEPGGHGQAADGPGSAARGNLVESVVIREKDYDDVLALADRENVPLNVLVAAAATAVDAASRGCTETLLVHALDNRFGDPELDVATCLVNSIAQPVRFPPHASVAEVVRAVDRGYVKAGRRRWLREEHYRRMYLAINRTTSVETLTLNFLREPGAPALMPYLADPPVTTHIGPVEGPTVAAVLDEQRRTLTLNIWDRHEQPRRTAIGFAGRVASALTSMTAMWDLPIAATVDAWHSIDEDGRLCSETGEPVPKEPAAPAWFLARRESIDECRRRRDHVDPWIARLLEIEAVPGDVLVFADDGTDQAIDLMIACHLAGCGYSVCDRSDQVGRRAEAIRAHADGIAVHIVDIDSADSRARAAERRALIEARVEQTVNDPRLATMTAYVMPTSGSTGEPKLVRVSHGSLAAFCVGMTRAYGWSADDTILQCAPLTSDISVEEVFGAASTGATLVRSAAVKAGDLQALAGELVARDATVVDLPTALWHLWCEDSDAIAAVGSSQLRQVVIGGEAIRPGAVDKWVNTPGTEGISLVSSYGPTETTVVVTYLPIIDGGRVVEHGARLRLGRPLVPHTVSIAFGEVVVVGEMVADGYLGVNGAGFGLVTTAGGRRYGAYATGDRVTVDGAGYPVFAGRRDALVKISGKRVDTAAITRTIMLDPAVLDIAVELHNGGLGVWFETQRTRSGDEDSAAAARIRRVLMDWRVASFVVTGVTGIPRKPNGKTDTARLHTVLAAGPHRPTDERSDERAAGLAGLWSAHLERLITPHTSLLSEGIGSLDLVRILPDTRRHLGRQVSIIDLISADTAANLVDDMSVGDNWMDAGTAAEIERDFAAFATPDSRTVSNRPRLPARRTGPILVLGASGILGTGFAEAILGLTREQRPDVVLAMRSVPPDNPAWAELRRTPGVRIEHLSAGFGPVELETLIRRTGTRTVVNCIGNTNVVVPYHELRSANVELVAAMAQTCADSGSRLVHLSTYVVNADVTAAHVVDPRQAPYPYAATKALAELAVGRGSELDFTIVRLPRVLGTPEQLRESTDILVSIADACHALRACPAVDLTEEVTTGHAAATSILRRLLELGESDELGRGIEVLRGQAVAYRELLGGIASRELDSHEWKRRLDESDWAKANPRRWSVIDAWIGLGLRLDGRSYAEYLAAYPALPLGIRSVGELVAPPPSLRELLAHGAGTGRGCPTTYQRDAARQ